MSANLTDALKAKFGELTEDQQQRISQQLLDAATDTVKAVEEKLPYIILQAEARETSRIAQAIMKGGGQ